MDNKLSPFEAFGLFMQDVELEYFAHGTWWELDDLSPINLFKKYDKWRVKHSEQTTHQ